MVNSDEELEPKTSSEVPVIQTETPLDNTQEGENLQKKQTSEGENLLKTKQGTNTALGQDFGFLTKNFDLPPKGSLISCLWNMWV